MYCCPPLPSPQKSPALRPPPRSRSTASHGHLLTDQTDAAEGLSRGTKSWNWRKRRKRRAGVVPQVPLHVSTEVFSPARGCQQVAMAVISLFFPPNSFHFFCAFLCLVGIGLDQCLLWCRLCSEATLGQCLGDDWFFLPIQCCCCSAVLSRLVGLDSFLGLW